MTTMSDRNRPSVEVKDSQVTSNKLIANAMLELTFNLVVHCDAPGSERSRMHINYLLQMPAARARAVPYVNGCACLSYSRRKSKLVPAGLKLADVFVLTSSPKIILEAELGNPSQYFYAGALRRFG